MSPEEQSALIEEHNKTEEMVAKMMSTAHLMRQENRHSLKSTKNIQKTSSCRQAK